MSSHSSSYRHVVPYTSQQPGWRGLFLALVVAGILGLSFRLYFSPNRIKGWIEAELAKQPTRMQLKFNTAELRLSRGFLPLLAIRLTDVEGRSAKSCAQEPGFILSEMHIPLRVLPLLRGQIAVGTVYGERLRVDLDALRDRCRGAAEVSARGSQEVAKTATTTVAASSSSVPASSVGARPWWTVEQLQTVRNLVSGLAFETLELRFENGRKHILFENLSVRSNSESQTLSVWADMHIPPELFFNQSLPSLGLNATLRPSSADVEFRGHLAEGIATVKATLSAVPDDVGLDARVSLSSVPLSELVPYASSWGVSRSLSASFRPKFMWLNCDVSISGRVRRLFKENPLKIENCVIDGNSGRVEVSRAEVGPGDKLQPLTVEIGALDLRKTFEMFGREGPSGVMSQYGLLSGQVKFRSKRNVSFAGTILNAEVLFSNRNIRAQQSIEEMRISGEFRDRQARISVEDATLKGGHFDGKLNAELDISDGSGTWNVRVNDLNFDPSVQKLMVNGSLRGLAIKGQGDIKQWKFDRFGGEMTVRDMTGTWLRAHGGKVKIETDNDQAHLDVSVTDGAIVRDAGIMTALKPVFLGYEFTEEWVELKKAAAVFELENRNLRWKRAKVSLLPGTRIGISSTGDLKNDGTLSGWIGIDFPKLKKLQWDMSGTVARPVLSPNSQTESELKRTAVYEVHSGMMKPHPGPAASVGKGLHSLGQKVIERAKAILPHLSPKGDKGGRPIDDAADMINHAGPQKP